MAAAKLKQWFLGLAFAGMSSAASADIGVGAGVTYVFGGNGLALGIKAFSSDNEDEGAASLGLDYVFSSRSWRPSIGAAYLFDSSYVDVTAGYNYGTGSWDLGLGAGFADTDDDDSAPLLVPD
ncbi:hypothetical protein [Marinobacterium rhizophilum]|uniref:Outer membrane protein beta-barrel domain-containing protein n=1 Tax=Marinobacterium rhizophilum TaxID=420402 RepID=A0ABY5HF39_9GAMM|nr:hypothetical protein [Marinobacterium rhizophilum]UTW10466.1 hypothetical protein KDW95_14295 [Marinobacterium rhizophilum]